jgi:hypothetical protein
MTGIRLIAVSRTLLDNSFRFNKYNAKGKGCGCERPFGRSRVHKVPPTPTPTPSTSTSTSTSTFSPPHTRREIKDPLGLISSASYTGWDISDCRMARKFYVSAKQLQRIWDARAPFAKRTICQAIRRSTKYEPTLA